jgi:hypothetical protein
MRYHIFGMTSLQIESTSLLCLLAMLKYLHMTLDEVTDPSTFAGRLSVTGDIS